MARYSLTFANGQNYEFDAQAGLSQDEAVSLLESHLQQTEVAPAPAEVVTDEEAREANTGFFNNLGSTLRQTDERAAAGISALMKGAGGDNAATQWLDRHVAEEDARNRREGTGAYIPQEHRPPGFDETVEAWQDPDVGMWDALGTTYDAVTSGTGRVVGGFAPAVAAGALAAPTALPTALVAGTALAATQHLPEAAAAQTAKHQEDIAAGIAPEGSAPDYNPVNLLGASAINTALDMFVLGKSVPFLGKLLGMGGKKLQSEAAKQAAEQGLTGAVLKGMLKTEAYEIPTEVLQGVVNRAAAGQDLSSPDAIAEMIETAKDVAISVPLLGAVGGVSGRASAQREVEANQNAAEFVKQTETKRESLNQINTEQVWVEEQQKDMTTAQKIDWENNYHPEGTVEQKLSTARLKKLTTEEKAETKKWQKEFEGKEFADQIAVIDAKVDAGATKSELKKWKKWIKKADVDTESNAALRPLHKKITEQLAVLAKKETEATPAPTEHVTLDAIYDDPDGTKLVNQTDTYKKLLAEERTDENILALDLHLTSHARKNDAVLRQYPNVDAIHTRADEIRAAQGKEAPPVVTTNEATEEPTTENIPYDTLTYDEENKKSVRSSGESGVISYSGRQIVIVNIGGVRVPFYKSTGLGGKKDVEAGKWYPFFGIGSDGWINKTSGKDINNYYGSAKLKQVAERLNETHADLKDVPKVSATGSHIAAINEGLTPTENKLKGTEEVVAKNISTLLERLAVTTPVTPTKPTDETTDEEKVEGQEGQGQEQTHDERMAETDATHTEFMEEYAPDTTHDPKDVEAVINAKEATLEKAKVRHKTATDTNTLDDVEYFSELEDNVQKELNAAKYLELKGQEGQEGQEAQEAHTKRMDETAELRDKFPTVLEGLSVDAKNALIEKKTKTLAAAEEGLTTAKKTDNTLDEEYFAALKTNVGKELELTQQVKPKSADQLRLMEVSTELLELKKTPKNERTPEQQKQTKALEAERDDLRAKIANPPPTEGLKPSFPLTKEVKETLFEDPTAGLKWVQEQIPNAPKEYVRDLESLTVTLNGMVNASKLKGKKGEIADLEAVEVRSPTQEDRLNKLIEDVHNIEQKSGPVSQTRRVTGDKVGPGFTGVEAKKIVDSFARKKRLHKLNIQVVDTAENLPDNVKADIAGDLAGIHGAYKDDIVYVVADSHSSPAQVAETIAHEAMGHAGFARMFQKDYDRSVTSLFRQLGGAIGIEKLAADLGVAEGLAPYVAEYKAAMQGTDQAAKNEAERMLTEELLAVAQGKEAVASLPARVWNALKAHVRRMVNWMKSKGFSDIEQLDATDVHNLLREMRDHSANTTLDTVTDKAALASKEGPVDIPGFEAPVNFPTDPKAAKEQIKVYDERFKADFDARAAEQFEDAAIDRAINREDDVYSDLGDGSVKSEVANKKVFDRWLDKWITQSLDYHAGMSTDLRRSYEEQMRQADWSGSKDLIGHMLRISNSQTVHDSAIGLQVLEHGGARYETDKEGFQWKWVAESVDALGNKLATWLDLSDIIDTAVEKYSKRGEKKIDARGRMEGLFTEYTTALRLRALHERNEELKNHLNALNEPDISTKEERAEAADRLKVKSKAASLAFKNKKGVWEFKPDTIKKVHWLDKDKNVDTVRIEGTIAQLAEEMPEVEDFVTTWNSVRANVLDVLVEGGLYTQRQAEVLLENESYVPFYRTTQMLAGQGPAEFTDGIQVEAERKLKGSMSDVGNVMTNIETWVIHEVSRAVRNKSATNLVKNAVAQGLGIELAKDEGSNVPNAVYAYINGHKTYFQLRDANYVNAFTGIDGAMIPAWNFGSEVAGILRRNIVLNPLFAIGQLTQDAFSAMLTSNLPFHQALKIPLKTITEFVKTVSGKSKVHEELKKVGVVGARDWSAAAIRGEAESHAHMQRTQKGKWGALGHAGGKLYRGLESFSMASDNAVRQAVYSVATEAGISKREAVEKAFELINFRKHGASAKLQAYIRLVPFLGAALQSHHVLYKVMTSAGISPGDRVAAQKQLLTNAAMIISISMALAMLHGDDEEYAKADAHRRSRSIYLGNGLWVPARQDLFTWMFKSIPEELYLNYTNTANVDARSLRETLSAGFLTAMGTPYLQQALKPTAEVIINRNLFTNRPIESQYMEDKATEEKWTATTSPLGRAMSEIGAGFIGDIMLSPVQLDHLLRGYFGLTGATIMLLSQQAGKKDDFVKGARYVGLDATRIPDIEKTEFFRNLLKTWGGGAGSREKTLMYDLLKETDKARTKFLDVQNKMLNSNMLDPEIKRQRDKEFKEWEKKWGKLNTRQYANFQKSFTNIRQAKNHLLNNVGMKQAEFNRRFKKLDDQERQMMKRADTMGYRELVGFDEGIFNDWF